MYEIGFAIYERNGMERTDSLEYWHTKHAEIVRKIPNVRRYLQSRALPGQPDLPFLGLATLAFDDEAAFQAAATSPEFAAAVGDLANFADEKRLPTVLMQAMPTG